MTSNLYFFLLIAAAIAVSAIQVIIKVIANNHQNNYLNIATDPLTFGAIFLYILAFIAWFIALSKLHFSTAIPVSAVSIIASAVIGYFLFGETLSLNKIIAFCLITIAMVILYIDLQ